MPRIHWHAQMASQRAICTAWRNALGQGGCQSMEFAGPFMMCMRQVQARGGGEEERRRRGGFNAALVACYGISLDGAQGRMVLDHHNAHDGLP